MMPDWNNRICTECNFRGGDNPLPGGDESTLACENCLLDFPEIVANEANYAILAVTDPDGEENEDNDNDA